MHGMCQRVFINTKVRLSGGFIHHKITNSFSTVLLLQFPYLLKEFLPLYGPLLFEDVDQGLKRLPGPDRRDGTGAGSDRRPLPCRF